MQSNRPLEAETAPWWQAPADPPGRRILGLLRAEPTITDEISATCPISQIAVTRHLEMLAEAGLMAGRRRAGGVATVSTLSRRSSCAGAGLDRSRPGSPRDSSGSCTGRDAGALRFGRSEGVGGERIGRGCGNGRVKFASDRRARSAARSTILGVNSTNRCAALGLLSSAQFMAVVESAIVTFITFSQMREAKRGD